MMAEREQGFIKYWDNSKNFGFVAYELGDRNGMYFPQFENDSEFWIPAKGDACSFVVDDNPRGGKMVRSVTKEETD